MAERQLGFGVEGDIQWSGEKGSAILLRRRRDGQWSLISGVAFLPAGGLAGTTLAIDQAAAVRHGPHPRDPRKVLFYGTGGIIFGEIKTTGTMSGFNPNGVG